MQREEQKQEEQKKVVVKTAPFPTSQPEDMSREEYLAIRQVTSGQLFGPRDLPRPLS